MDVQFEDVGWSSECAEGKTEAEFVEQFMLESYYSQYTEQDRRAMLKEVFRLIKTEAGVSPLP